MSRYGILESGLGPLLLVRDADGLCQLTFENHSHPRPVQPGWPRDDDAFTDVAVQLREYLAGERKAFDIALSLHGTPFQQQVWQALRRVPFGRTTTYAELARAINRPEASHAVGAAVSVNPVSILVPCHRVLGSDGSLTGYAGGLQRKARLLALEGSLLV